MISPCDSVAVATEPLSKGGTYTVGSISVTLADDIPFAHKVAVRDIKKGENVIKYANPIGRAAADIKKGEHVHVHNLKTNLSGLLEYKYEPDTACFEAFKSREEATFEGYVRSDGSVGTRNELWIIPTVGCVNTTATTVERMAREKYPDFFDGIWAYPHPHGCSQLGEDHETMQHVLRGLIRHPNAGGVLVLSLGCENNCLENFRPVLGDIDEKRVKFLVTQDVEDEYESAMALIDELVENMKNDRRTAVSASKLVLGFKCGASDAFSGVTANVLCGRVTDYIVRHGGSSILTEVPEMFGAETLLMRRAANEEVFSQIVALINDFKTYFTRYNQTIYENPSPGNKKGGITTLEEKSLGCTQKGGTAPVAGVLEIGSPVKNKGLNLLTGPGNDLVSLTNVIASGAQIVLFTTGRGNPLGGAVPTIKISSNTPLYERKKHWIDFNAGVILDGKSFDDVTESFFSYILDVASGRIKTRNELNGYKDIGIFKDGVTL